MKWIRDLIIRRIWQESIFAFVVTNDVEQRISMFLRALPSVNEFIKNFTSTTIDLNHVYIYNPWHGVHRVVYGREGISLEKISITRQPQQLPYTPFPMFMKWIEDQFVYSLRVSKTLKIFITYGLGRSNELEMILKAWLYEPRGIYYDQGIYMLFFTESSDVIPQDIINNVIYVKVYPSLEEYEQLINKSLEVLTHSLPVPIETRLSVKDLVNIVRGLSLRTTESLLCISVTQSLIESGGTKIILSPDYIMRRKAELIKTELLKVVEPSGGFEQVGGFKYVKDFLKTYIIDYFRNLDKASRLGLKPPTGILLFGPPGSGKSWIIEKLSGELGFLMFKISMKTLSRWYGETERNIEQIFETIEQYSPCILYIDEADMLLSKRVEMEHEVTRRIKNLMLHYLGKYDRNYIVVLATNKPLELDEAILERVGRISDVIPILYPDLESRLEILKVHTEIINKVPLSEDVDLQYIAEQTVLFTSDDLRGLVEFAKRYAFRDGVDRVYMKHFEKALRNFKIDYQKRIEDLRQWLEISEKLVRDVEILEQVKKIYENELNRVKTRFEILTESLKGTSVLV